MFWSASLSHVKKVVKNDVIMTSLAYYGVKNVLFDHLDRYKIVNNDPIDEKIGGEADLIKISEIRSEQNSDLHDAGELSNAVSLDRFGQKMVSKDQATAKEP